MSIFPTLQKLAPKATLLYSSYPGSLTRSAPSQLDYGNSTPPPPTDISLYYDTATPPGACPAGAAVVCWQRFTGTDSRTQFGNPTASPLFVYDGGSIEGMGVYIIDRYRGFGLPAADHQAAFDAVIGTATVTEKVRGIDLPVLHCNHYNKPYNDYNDLYFVQSHYSLYRRTGAVGFVDLETVCFETIQKVPDQSTRLSQTYRFRVIHDYKTSGDFRYAVSFIMANSQDAINFPGVTAGDIGFLFTADNNANGGLTQAEFVRMKNYDVVIPTGYYKASLYWHRSTDYNDLTTGRFVYKITDLETGLEQVIFDINASSIAAYNIAHPLACTNNGGGPATNCVNRHKGINNSPWQRLFVMSNYSGGVSGQDTDFYLAKLDIWDDAPFDLPNI